MRKHWRKVIVAVVLVAVLAGWFIAGATALEYAKAGELNLFVRDIVIATIANAKAGDKVPVEIDYSLSQPYNPNATWGIETNSLYLSELARLIVPYFIYEGVLEEAMENYPDVLVIIPNKGYRSFHILGSAQTELLFIRINERFVLDDWRLDERQVLATMIHELAHLQGGKLAGGPPHWEFPNVFEANAQSVTVEVLAGMCYHGNDLACSAFWEELFSYARGSFRMRLRRYKLEQLYEPISSLLWYDKSEEMRAEKSMRYWYGHEDRKRHLYEIVYMYQQAPFDNIILPGVLGQSLDTGLVGECEVRADTIECKPMLMPFDDSQAMLGKALLWFIELLS